jgi:hypothetical protein
MRLDKVQAQGNSGSGLFSIALQCAVGLALALRQRDNKNGDRLGVKTAAPHLLVTGIHAAVP